MPQVGETILCSVSDATGATYEPFTKLAVGKAQRSFAPLSISAAVKMRSQTTCHSRPHGPHLVQFLLLSLLAIVGNSINVSFQPADQGTGKSGQFSKANIMISAQCRFDGHEVGCPIPVSRTTSIKGLLIPSSRIIRGQLKVSGHSRHSKSRSIFLSDSRHIESSSIAPSYVKNDPNLQADSSMSIASTSQVSRPRPHRRRRLGVGQILSQSAIRSKSPLNNSGSHRRSETLDSSKLMKDAKGLPNEDVSLTGSSGKDFRQSLQAASQSLSMSKFAENGHDMRMHPASRRQKLERGYPGNRLGRTLAHLFAHSGDDLAGKNSQLLVEDSQPVATDGPSLNTSNLVEHWKAPPLESGPLIIITVAQGVAANFSSIQKAVDSVPPRNTQRVIIRIHAGNYSERVAVPYNKPFITFHGDENGGTVVSWNATARSSEYARDFEISDAKFARMENASASLFGTMHSASVTILSDGFVAQHMVFQNTAPPPEPGAVGAQAVALLIGGDRAAFYYCGFLGAQDTLYDYIGRHYYLNCYIQGSIDFIFGNGRSLFEGCHLHSIATSFGAIAAHQRLSPEDDTGFSFDRCTVTGSGKLYLGRAWSPFARIVFARTYLENIISAEGWSDFGDPRRQSTTFFGQYQCTGPGANLTHRASWAKLLTDDDVRPYLGLNFVNGKQWLGAWPMGPVQNETRT